MPTNIGAIVPRAHPLAIVTRSNADWRDAFPFDVAGTAAGYPAVGNVGSGSISVANVAPQTALGAHEIQIVEAAEGEPAQFTVRTPSDALSGIGRVGVPIYAGGVTLIVRAGARAFAVGDSFSLGVTPIALDITGIQFDLMLRSAAKSANVALRASTQDGTLANGGANGAAGLRVPRAVMQAIPPGSYVYDLLARADGIEIVPYFGDLTHDLGVTRITA